MIFISTYWSETMLVGDHTLAEIHQIDASIFQKLAVGAESCIDMPNLARILGVKFNPSHIQLRPGDSLLKVAIKGGKLSHHDNELPENVYLEYYCYTIYSPNTHVIEERIENEKILMEE